MARELSQEALLDFLCQAGGRVTNAALLGHFHSFLRDPAAPPDLREHRRQLFKGFVNSVAAVRQDPDGTKCVVLRRRYRDLVGEGPGLGALPGAQRRGARPCPAAARDQLGTPSPGPPHPQGQRPAPSAQDQLGTASPGPPHPQRQHPAPPTQDQAGTRSPEIPHLQRQRPAPSAQDQPGTPSPGPPYPQRQHPAPPARDQPGTPSLGPPHPQRQHPAPLARDQQPGTTSPEIPHLQRQHPVPSAQDQPGTPSPGPPHPQCQHPASPAWDRPETVTPGTPSPKTSHLQRQQPAPSAQDWPEPVTLGTPSAETPHFQWDNPATPARDRPEPETPNSLYPETVHLQLQRTREWVVRHQQMPEPTDPGPVRAWSVLPDDFLQLRSEQVRGLFPGVPAESSEPWLGKPPPTVFRSIRCQLSLQDLEDFVDQESHGSEESSSEPRESPGGSEEGVQAVLGGLSASPKKSIASPRPQDLGRGSHRSTQAPPGAPKTRRSFRRSPQAGRATLSSSDEECLDEDLLKSIRRPPRLRKPSKAGPVPSPRVDAPLTPKLAGIKAVVAEPGRSHSGQVPSREGPAALVPHRPFEHKSSLVPLESREHDWIVKLASGSWIQVLALFREDPQLALHRDFLTGYTALHWIAKHGSLRALQDLVSGARKTGIVLDVNVRSSCGYTPLHLAAIHGHQGVIKLLVQKLASRVNVRDSSGKKPWQYLASNTSGEIWQLLGAPRGKPIFPVHPLVQNSSSTGKTKSRETSRHITRKTSLAALLKSQHNKWKLANHQEKFSTPREREEYSD
ncbi:PREDICTED: ankyrin repeat domain-containing protein SOWAHB [Chinchilla lanigera]|uniref:ankyrin repeat domain-containing protein SOWAHB n=1 Tax=Chinchilla lanigera TaxID=34839 RepID=UPI00038ECD15|nr:PREDICTED: ankyrin repeat domain-containing protein SOWAHB [Chinchilla lanigera]